MKKITIIDGKKKTLNTDTAKICATAERKIPRDNPLWLLEMLFFVEDGIYFLYGRGGFLTRYSKIDSIEKNRVGGDNIVCLTLDQAKKWYYDKVNNIYIEFVNKEGFSFNG